MELQVIPQRRFAASYLEIRIQAKAPILDYLGIPYKRKNGQTFWEANLGELEYLYNDFTRAVRIRLAELHPDRHPEEKKEASAEEFILLRKAADSIRKSFSKRGIGTSDTLYLAQRREERFLEKRAKLKRKKRNS